MDKLDAIDMDHVIYWFDKLVFEQFHTFVFTELPWNHINCQLKFLRITVSRLMGFHTKHMILEFHHRMC